MLTNAKNKGVSRGATLVARGLTKKIVERRRLVRLARGRVSAPSDFALFDVIRIPHPPPKDAPAKLMVGRVKYGEPIPASFLARQVRAALAPLREKHFLSRLFAVPKSEASMVPLRPCGERRDYRGLLMIHNKRIGRKINNRVAKAVTIATQGCPLPILIATAIPMATAIANIVRVIAAMRKIARFPKPIRHC